jgi:hypothetical protein
VAMVTPVTWTRTSTNSKFLSLPATWSIQFIQHKVEAIQLKVHASSPTEINKGIFESH